jgi:EAL domain-containing protein (putative c-di-GMP-specific phosphodiesterase class I)
MRASLSSLLGDGLTVMQKLIFEVAETAAIDNLDVTVRSLRKFRNLGCCVAPDDFGSGYSSYGYVRNLPLDYLKIGGTYIRNILTYKIDRALTASMVDVAHSLGLEVIAECRQRSHLFLAKGAGWTMCRVTGYTSLNGQKA